MGHPACEPRMHSAFLSSVILFQFQVCIRKCGMLEAQPNLASFSPATPAVAPIMVRTHSRLLHSRFSSESRSLSRTVSCG